MTHRRRRGRSAFRILVTLMFLGATLGALAAGALLLWASTLRLPNLDSFADRKVPQSTKMYDRTGEVLLYDIHEEVRRTVVPYNEIASSMKNATVAIEDSEFYMHHGIRPKAILRAVFANLSDLEFSQGGSTITQQVIKNSFLTKEKTITRKLKEWILAVKLERVASKDEILSIYLNDAPYGGNIYGVEETSQAFFSKPSSELSLAESAYLAAIPKAPTYFSPYGNHRKELEERKNLVLERMQQLGFISNEEYESARATEVKFNRLEERGIKAPHFVIYVKELLVEKYGEDAVEEGGLKVITTLDFNLQKSAQEIVHTYALENKEKFNAENAGLVAIDPRTGEILVMVGSRDYFDPDIDGNFNVTTARRQPGSSFKPFAYAKAFEKGYLPETVVFDLETEFSTECSVEGKPLKTDAVCYKPKNYDNIFRGPISFRNALAQSVNVPSVKVLYLAGIRDTLGLARQMGISTLENADRYGLTLVLGGGEVMLLEMTSAYGVFADEGVRREPQAILRIENESGEVVESLSTDEERVLPREVALTITNVLSDNVARAPAFGESSWLNFPGKAVAAKTGTTNDYRDAWILGYTPSIAVGAWAGNNDNSSMEKRVAGFIVAPLWHAFMQVALERLPDEQFASPPTKDTKNYPPVIRGHWQGGLTYVIDRVSGKLATDQTPETSREERVVRSVHSILHWVSRDNPLGPPPSNPEDDSQYLHWEKPVRAWAEKNGFTNEDVSVIPKESDDVHLPDRAPRVSFVPPLLKQYHDDEKVIVVVESTGSEPATKAEFYLDGRFIGSSSQVPFSVSFVPNAEGVTVGQHTVRAVITDVVLARGEAETTVEILPGN